MRGDACAVHGYVRRLRFEWVRVRVCTQVHVAVHDGSGWCRCHCGECGHWSGMAARNWCTD